MILFPRSIFRCLTIIKKSFQNLPKNDEALLFIDKFLENLKVLELENMITKESMYLLTLHRKKFKQ